MKVTGIIAEYNPFHNGHLYQLNQVKQNGADYIVVVMSGNFVQRGTPAIIDKYERTTMALKNGADLVLELPTLFACSSASYFAKGGVSLLHNLGVVDSLCFGCETKQPDVLMKAADFLSHEPLKYQERLQSFLKAGHSFPRARELAITELLGDTSASILNAPNNILALEYCIALGELNSNIVPFPIKREGNGYHEGSLSRDVLPSASAIRSSLLENVSTEELKHHVPASVYMMLTSKNHKHLITANDFSSQLIYKLLLEEKFGFKQYLDITPDLSDKIIKNINEFNSYEDFCMALKSKDLTYSRISRGLLHILLNITNEHMNMAKEKGYSQYARILGFRENATPLLSAIKQNASIPLIGKLSDASDYLSPEAQQLLDIDILSSHIYKAVMHNKLNVPFTNEYTRQIIKTDSE